MRKLSYGFLRKVIPVIVGRTATKPRLNHRGLYTAVIALTFLLTFGNAAVLAQTYAWTERQPAGDTDKNWSCGASSSDGAKLIVGVNNGRLYKSTDGGLTWTETQPAGDRDKRWRCVASSSDGSKLIAGASAGRLYTSTDVGVT